MNLRHSRVIVATAALAVVAGGAYWGLGDDGVTGFGSGKSAMAAPAVVRNGEPVKLGQPVAGRVSAARVDVLVDGWSARILKGTALTTSVGGGAEQKLRLAPATAADVRELLAHTPQIVADVLARQVTGSSDVKCDTGGCSAAGKKLDVVGYITNPGSVPGFGDMYAGWGVKSLLYYAGVDAGDGTGDVEVRAAGYSPVELDALPTGAAGTKPDAFNGYLRNRYLLGSAFQKLFIADPQWLGENPVRYKALEPASVPAFGDEPTRTIHHVLGLNQSWPGTEELSPSVLTYLSSPTSGCDVGVLCVPERVATEISNPVHDQQRVCAVVNGERTDQIAVFDTAVISATFPHPTSQFGLWGGKGIEDFGHGTGLLRGGTPPLAEGKQSMRWNSLGLLDSDEGSIRVTAGSVGPASAPASTLTQMLSEVSLDGTKWVPCDAPTGSDTN